MKRRTVLIATVSIALVAPLLMLRGCGDGNGGNGDDDTAEVRWGRLVVWVEARGNVTAESNVTIAPPRWWGLKISRLVAREGEKVKKGDVLLELDTEPLEERVRDRSRDIRAATGALKSAEANLSSQTDALRAEVHKFAQDLEKAKGAHAQIKALPLETDLANALIDRDTTRQGAARARVRYENMKQLYDRGGGVSLQQVEQRELEFRSAVCEAKRAELTHQLIKDGATDAELADAELVVEMARVDLKRAEITRDLTIGQLQEVVNKATGNLKMNQGNLARVQRIMDACTVRAPVDGTVFYRKIRSSEGLEKIKEGMEVRPWYRLMDLPDTTRMQIQVKMAERDIGMVQLGQIARIVLDAYGEETFTAKVTKVEPITKAKSGRGGSGKKEEREDLGTKIVEVWVTFDEQSDRVRPGLNGRAEIRTEESLEGLLIPRKALFTSEGRDVVYRMQNGERVKTPVRIGGRDEKHFLIVGGIEAGDRVSLTSPKEQGSGRDKS